MDQFITKLLSGKKSTTNLVDQLYKIPRPEKNGDNTTFQHISNGVFQFFDTLYLPNDKGYVYALVGTDQGSRKLDLEPMKSRSSNDIVTALKAIYKRKILIKPKVIVTDAGSEFKKNFDTALDELDIQHKTVKPGRHRSVALVERKNQTIGKILHKIMLQVKLSTGNATSKWISYAKKLVKLINEQVVVSNSKIEDVPLEDQVLEGNPNHVIKLLNVGDKVRVALDNPQDLHGKTLFGKFRSSDIRWSRTLRTVKEVLMEPNQPVMYLLNGSVGPLKIEPVGYTYNQLQKVSSNEKEPEIIAENELNRFEVAKITDRRKVGRSYEYLVWWKPSTEPKSWEKRAGLVEDLGALYMDKLDKRFDAKNSK